MKKFFLNVMVVIFAFFAMAENDSGEGIYTHVSDFEWVATNGYVIVSDYVGTNAIVNIPQTLNGLPVKTIGRNAFRNNRFLKDVSLPYGITLIENSAFEGCSSLANVTIPDSVTYIGNYAFRRCNSIVKIVIPDGVSIGINAFQGCVGLSDDNGFVVLHGVLYDYCGNDSNVIIPNSVTNIDWFAFESSKSIESVVIPDSVMDIGHYAFQNCTSLRSVTLPDKAVSVGTHVFRGCTGLSDDEGFIILKNVLYTHLKDTNIVVIPDGVMRIADFAFDNHSSLENITIPKGVTEIGEHAFRDCKLLTCIILPDSITNIKNYAFNGCISMADIVFDGNAPVLEGKSVFYGIHPECTAHVKRKSTGWNVEIPGKWNGINIVYQDGIYVNGGGDALQNAVNEASEGDTIYVASGIYSPVSVTRDNLKIIALNGASNTIIDAALAWPKGITNRCATLGSTTNAVLRGFTLLNGKAENGYGGGAYYGTLEDCVITGCSAYYGGGTYYSILSNCTVRSNSSSQYGGGTYYGTLYGCTVANNSSSYYGGGSYYGTLYGCTVTNNSVTYYGGGVCYATVHDSILSDNRASNSTSYGGGAYYGTLERCIIRNNTSYNYGGGTYGSTLRNCLVIGNRTTYSQGLGGGVYSGTALNCTIYGNTSSSGGGACYGTLINSIVWGNTATRVSSAYANISNVTCYCVCSSPLPTGGSGNMANDPQFVNAREANYSLASNSPCIDAGMIQQLRTAVDLAGNPRIRGNKTDLGAYECQIGAVQGVDPKTFYVDAASGSDDFGGLTSSNAFRSIGAAIDAAFGGDTILVGPGVYAPVKTDNKPIIIRSTDGPDVTIIDADPALNGGAANRCATLGVMASVNETNSVLVGFTLRNGRGRPIGGNSTGSYGGGAFGGYLKNCVLTNNVATYGGGAYYGKLTGCRIVGNVAGYVRQYNGTSTNMVSGLGGGVYHSYVNRSLVAENRATNGGGVYGSGLIANSIIARNSAMNYGGGIYGSAGLVSCTVTENFANTRGGGYYCASSYPYVYNSILWDNASTNGVSNYYLSGSGAGYLY